MTEQAEQADDIELPREGDVLAGKYRIERVLGQGGMGVVVAAHHISLRQKVAVKFLLPQAAKRGDSCERFLREARAAVSIQSEHVARVTDVGTLDTGAPYMVMEFLTGADLDKISQERGPLPVTEAVDYVLQACEAIAEAHAIGLIHRDLKPANLFVTKRADGSPLVKVLDFGLSKATKPDAMDASLTAAHVVMGSPYYMSPEQIRNFKTIDARADIWSLGVILFQLLTGTTPFQAESLGALFLAIGSDPVPPIRDFRHDVPPELDEAIRRCLEKDVKARTQSVSELARALAPFGGDTSHISAERIARVLEGSAPIQRAPGPSQPPRPTLSAGISSATVKPPLAKAVKSGSMAAMSVSDSAASAQPPASPASSGKSRRALAIGTLVALPTVALAVVVARGLTPGGTNRSYVQTTAEAATPAPTASAATATLAPIAGSAAPSLAPVASSSAPGVELAVSIPSATAAVASQAIPRAPSSSGRSYKKPAPAPEASAAPKLSKPISAALKHNETFD